MIEKQSNMIWNTTIRKLWILVALCAFAFPAIPLNAQNYPVAEISGGYRLSLDDDFFLGDSQAHLNGFAVGGEFNINRFFGIAGELGYGMSTFSVYGISHDRNQTTVLVGPRFSHRGKRNRLFGHLLVGLSHEASDNTLASPQKISTNNIALDVGAGWDISIGNRISIRPFQLDIMSTRHARAAGYEHQLVQLRYLGGITVKLGSDGAGR